MNDRKAAVDSLPSQSHTCRLVLRGGGCSGSKQAADVDATAAAVDVKLDLAAPPPVEVQPQTPMKQSNEYEGGMVSPHLAELRRKQQVEEERMRLEDDEEEEVRDGASMYIQSIVRGKAERARLVALGGQQAAVVERAIANRPKPTLMPAPASPQTPSKPDAPAQKIARSNSFQRKYDSRVARAKQNKPKRAPASPSKAEPTVPSDASINGSAE